MDVERLLEGKRIVICAGSGGVGKTTTAAALGVAAARAGRKVLVLTIDPARRLAEAMGLSEGGAEPTPIPPERLHAGHAPGPGQLDVWMLDPRVVFERFVRKLSPTPEAARTILENRLYRFLSDLVAGMQEYAAAEALDNFLDEGRYELIVLDTPPSRHALDFLEAPGRLARFLDDRIVSLFLPEEKGRGGRLWRKTSQLVGNVLGGIFGEGFTQEMRTFLGAFSGLFSGIRLRADRLRSRLSSPDAAFLLVTSPDAASLEEAAYFRDMLREKGLPFAGFVLNRSWAREDGLSSPEALLRHVEDDTARGGVEALIGLADQERARAEAHRGLLRRLAEKLPAGAVAVAAPEAGGELEDFGGLVRLGEALATS